jgi:SAM-dependent methyltransferase
MMTPIEAHPTSLLPEGAFGFAEALIAAQASIEESSRVLRSYGASQIPCTDAPIHFDSRSISVLAYKSAIERVKERFWTTTFLGSGFWSGTDGDILEANIRMMANCRRTGAIVRRLFLLTLPPEEEIQRVQDERMLLRKCEDFDGLARFDRRIANLSANIHRLFQHGCDVRVVHDAERLHRHLPAELSIDSRDTEFAIYDDWRFDLFQGGLFGTIQSVRGYTPVMTRFRAYRDELACYFEKLWEKSASIEGFLDRLHKAVEYSSTRIDYPMSWLVRYDHALPREDEALKIEELTGVRVELVRLGRWGRIQRFLDVGTCTGRYLISLRDAVGANGVILGVDNDIDCVRFTQAKVRRELEDDRRFQIERHDFCAPEPPSTHSFDLITCMLGTICHFEWQAADGPPYDDAFQRALDKFARLLTEDGLLFFSVWTEGACRDLRLLSIYSEEDKRRLAKAVIPRKELRRRLESARLQTLAPILLQDRMELYRCERRH